MGSNDKTNPVYEISILDYDREYYIQAFKTVRPELDDFRATIILILEEDTTWTIRLPFLSSREWLYYCATVYSLLPGGSEDDREEVEVTEEVSEAVQEVLPTVPAEPASEEDSEEEPEDEGDEEEEESPGEEIERKIKRAKVVRRTGDRAVTVESD